MILIDTKEANENVCLFCILVCEKPFVI